MWWLALAGCGVDGVTSETTLSGRLLDPSGAPVEGVLVQSLEGQDRTDAEGRFAVEVKPPDQLAHFLWRDLWVQRTLAPSDYGQVLDLRLPPTRDATVVCPPEPCDLLLVWELGPRFEAQLRHACKPKAEVEVPAAPTLTPSVRCTVGKGAAAQELDLEVIDRGDTLRLVPGGVPIRVEVRAPGGHLPDDCVVRVGDRVAAPAGPGFWSAEAAGPVTVVAVCGGRPALPVLVDPAEQPEGVTLDWSASGPTLDLEGVAPWAAEAVVVAEEAGWNLSLAPTSEGLFPLPPLPAGSYRLLVRSETAELPLLAQPPAPAGHGVLAVAEAGEGALVGRLQVVEDLESGTVRVAD